MPDLDRLLAGLTEEQREAVTSDAAPLLVLAGAGSGKTRVLTRRIAWQAAGEHLDARRVLAVTFTRKASRELTSRLTDLGLGEHVTAGTFHALALAQLRRRRLDQGRRPPALVERKSRLLGKALRRHGHDVVAAVAREIEWAQARGITPEGYAEAAGAARRTLPLTSTAVADAYEKYRAEKRTRGLVDFDDLLSVCADEIEGDAEFAAATRWRFRHLFVDEFQDLSPAQFRLVKAWLGDRDTLFAVGDDDQAIYGFGGADARYLTDFTKFFGKQAQVLRLTANFRSTPQILALANAVTSPRPGDTRRLLSTAADGPSPSLTGYASDLDEAAALGRTIAELQRGGVAYREFAVLARTNAQCAFLEEALTGARIPVHRAGSSRFLDRPDVEAALSALETTLANGSAPSLRAAAHEAVARAPLTGPGSEDALAALEQLAIEYADSEGEPASAAGFRDFLTTTLRHDDPRPRPDAVEVLTFHRAKGLEWPVVFVTGLEDGFVPISHAVTADARTEERRLLHVALTRAQRRLLLSYARRRRFGGGRPVTREPSPFIVGLDTHLPDAHEVDQVHATDAGRQALAEAAAHLRVTSPGPGRPRPVTPETDPLIDALRVWREQRARAAGVVEAAVLDDETLEALSTARPSDAASLGLIPGFGAARAARYGPEIIDLIADYAP